MTVLGDSLEKVKSKMSQARICPYVMGSRMGLPFHPLILMLLAVEEQRDLEQQIHPLSVQRL